MATAAHQTNLDQTPRAGLAGDGMAAARRREPMNEKIGVREMPLPQVERVDVYRNSDHLVMMVDGRVYALSRAAATELAYSICSHIEAMDHR